VRDRSEKSAHKYLNRIIITIKPSSIAPVSGSTEDGVYENTLNSITTNHWSIHGTNHRIGASSSLTKDPQALAKRDSEHLGITLSAQRQRLSVPTSPPRHRPDNLVGLPRTPATSATANRRP